MNINKGVSLCCVCVCVFSSFVFFSSPFTYSLTRICLLSTSLHRDTAKDTCVNVFDITNDGKLILPHLINHIDHVKDIITTH